MQKGQQDLKFLALKYVYIFRNVLCIRTLLFFAILAVDLKKKVKYVLPSILSQTYKP